MPFDTGWPQADAQDDFQRARRARALARLSQRLRREPDDVDLILPFEEVVAALGRVGQRALGLQVVELDSIVGTVDRRADFDRHFRPTSARVRTRFERLALAQRRGESVPPISLFRIGGLHFVRDGHHRVAVARALGRGTIDAFVTEVLTRVAPGPPGRLSELLLKGHERVFAERVPLGPERLARIRLSEPEGYDALAEGVEAWGFRLAQERGELIARDEVARRWYQEEYEPVVAMLGDAGLIGEGPEADAYMYVARERYRLLRTHAWSPEVVAELADRLATAR